MPNGYPHSVSSEYSRYIRWFIVHSSIGSASYVLSMTALLHSVNVSSGAAGIAAGTFSILYL